MSFPLIMAGQTPYEVLRLLASNSEIATRVREFFQPRCDCDIVEWVKQRILASDPTVIDALKGLIQADVVDPPAYPATSITVPTGTNTFLLRTWCASGVRMGEFLNHDGTKYTVTMWVGDPSCA